MMKNNPKKTTLPFNVMLQFNEKMFQNASPSQILSIALALDLSGSMNSVVDGISGKTCLDLLCDALNKMVDTIAGDPLLRTSVELEIITFNSEVEIVRNFSTLEKDSGLPTLVAGGITLIGEAVSKAAEELRIRKKFNLQQGSSHVLSPVLIVLSDGVAFESSPEALARGINECKSKDFNVVPVLIGNAGDDSGYLGKIGDPINVSELAIGDLFEGIVAATTSSLSTVAESSFRELLASALSWSTVLK